MPLNGPALSQALATALGADAADGLQQVHTTLCRREAGAFQRAAKSGDDLLVACTQESRLFLELNAETEGAPGLAERPIRFVNIRETGGWSKDASGATPKLAALIAAAQVPEPEPVATVSYRSAGRTLIVGSPERCFEAAALLSDALDISVLLTEPGGRVPQQRDVAVHEGEVTAIGGWLGNFSLTWQSANPIDADLCTRCNACIAACPEGAIDFSYRVDLAKCGSHRECVRVCEAAGAIDFTRAPQSVTEPFDMVLDLQAEPLLTLHQPPQGYVHVADPRALTAAVLALRGWVGEFEKPKFFHYKQKLCAHSRNEQLGCTACIDVCSAQAVRSDASLKGRKGSSVPGDAGRRAKAPATGGIVVEPHLCVGCGACTTVCPSGALTYATPRADAQGKRMRTMLDVYRKAGGRDAALLLHSQGAGTALIGELGRAARSGRALQGVPARVLPLDVWHTASVGIDLWLSALAFGASQVWVLMTDEEAPEYRAAVAAQMAVAQAIASGLGLTGAHFRIVSAVDVAAFDAALQAPAAQTIKQPATFSVQADKRATLDLAIDHLAAQAVAAPEVIVLPAHGEQPGSPFGSLAIDTAACTLCLSCVGACPEAALADNADAPQLRFIEKNCVQCGLCVKTCPENALTLEPRLWLADGGKARKQLRVLNEAPPYRCVRCQKPFGTLRAVENMVARLAGHSMFQGVAAERLKMCSDCRVIDIHTNAAEVKITDL